MWLQSVVAVPVIGVVSAHQDSLAGVWKGESVCLNGSSACTSEAVIYYLEDVPGKSGQILVQADKVVDGKAITMGKGIWTYDRARRALEWEAGGRIWSLHVEGSQMEGALTLPNKTIFRRMTLQKLS